MDPTLLSALFSFQRKMKPVLESIRDSFSYNSALFVSVSIYYTSPFQKKDGLVVFVCPTQTENTHSIKMKMCSSCESGSSDSAALDSDGMRHALDFSDFYNCRCSVGTLFRRLDFLSGSARQYDYTESSSGTKSDCRNIVFKCCSICGQYLYGGTSALQCTNKSHFKFDFLRMITEDEKYLRHLLKVDCLRNMSLQEHDSFRWKEFGVRSRPDFDMINVLAFHLETRYFFVEKQDLFRAVFEFIDKFDWRFRIFYEKSIELFRSRTPPYF